MTAPRSRVAAVLLSLFIPGLGHTYLGVVGRALLFIALNPLLAIAVAVAAPEASRGVMIATLVLVLVATRIAAAVDVLLVLPERYHPLGLFPRLALIAGALALAQATALILRAGVMEAFKVPAGSMMPSILAGDHVFVDKIVHRKRDPRRGELVVFKYPEHPEQDFVKRVAGVGGDSIAVRDGALVINGWDVPRCKVGAWTYADPSDGSSHRGTVWIEFLEDSAYYVFLDDQAFGSPYQGPYTVARGQTFVLGDNRNSSHDSRMWWGGAGGGVPRENVKGRPRVVWVSTQPGRAGIDLDDLGPPPSPELAEGVKRCVAERPPREKTSPPSSPAVDR